MSKTVHNKIHYQIKALLKNPDFIQDIQELKEILEKYNLYIPKEGFNTQGQFSLWRDAYWEAREKAFQSSDYLNAVAETENGKEQFTSEEIDRIRDIKDQHIPPIYIDYLHNLLAKYDFDRKDKKLQHFIERYFFFNQQELKEYPLYINHKRNRKTGKMELFVKIEPWTTKKDLEEAWSGIKEEQQTYQDYIERNVPWAEFDRDIEIYTLYKQVMKTRNVTKIKATDMHVYAELHSKYPEINNDLIRKIYKKARNILERSDT
jgi:hypothetical protein